MLTADWIKHLTPIPVISKQTGHTEKSMFCLKHSHIYRQERNSTHLWFNRAVHGWSPGLLNSSTAEGLRTRRQQRVWDPVGDLVLQRRRSLSVHLIMLLHLTHTHAYTHTHTDDVYDWVWLKWHSIPTKCERYKGKSPGIWSMVLSCIIWYTLYTILLYSRCVNSY